MLQSVLNEVARRNENCLSPAPRRDKFFHFSKTSLETINICKPANEVRHVRLVETERYFDNHYNMQLGSRRQRDGEMRCLDFLNLHQFPNPSISMLLADNIQPSFSSLKFNHTV